MRSLSIGLIALVAIASTGKPNDPTDAAIAALSKTVAEQAAIIKQLRSGGSCADADDPEPELRAFRAAEQQKRAEKKQEELITLFTTTAGEPLTAVAVSNDMLEKKVPRLIVGGAASGALHLFDKNGTLRLTEQVVDASISAVVIGPKDDPFVVVGTSAGEVLLYNLTLPRLATPKRPSTGSTTLKLAMRAEPQLDESGNPIPVLTLDAYMRGRKANIAVGDASGTVRLLLRNGTQRATVSVGGAVRAMERGGANNAHMALAPQGVGVTLMEMGKPNSAPMHCDGSEPADGAALVTTCPSKKKGKKGTCKALPAPPHVVALTWDVQLPQLLYTASSDGIISIYNSKARTRQMTGEFNNISKMVTHCKLVTTITGHEAAPIGLTPVKGYLFSASPSLLASHNVSGLYARTRDEPNVMLGRALAGSPHALAGTRDGHLVVASGPLGEISMLQTKQVFKAPGEDDGIGSTFGGSFGSKDGGMSGLSLLRNPLVLGVVMMLVFWQSNKFMNKGDGGGNTGFGGRRSLDGRGGLNDFDMDQLKGMMRQGGKGGSEFDEAFKHTFGRAARGDTDFSRDPDVMAGIGRPGRPDRSSRLEEIE